MVKSSEMNWVLHLAKNLGYQRGMRWECQKVLQRERHLENH